MATILRGLRSVIWGFPKKKTARMVPCEKMPYQPRLRPVLLYARYKNEALR